MTEVLVVEFGFVQNCLGMRVQILRKLEWMRGEGRERLEPRREEGIGD
jgi:hypothetical protein